MAAKRRTDRTPAPAKANRKKATRGKGQLARRRYNAAYRRANRGRVEQVEGAIEAALAEGAKLREAISRKIEPEITTAGTRDRRAPRRR
jgi:hypothetical protein